MGYKTLITCCTKLIQIALFSRSQSNLFYLLSTDWFVNVKQDNLIKPTGQKKWTRQFHWKINKNCCDMMLYGMLLDNCEAVTDSNI